MPKRMLLRIFVIFIIVVLSSAALELLFRLYRNKDLTLKLTMGKPIKKYSHDFEPNTEFRLKSSKKEEFDVFVKINNFGFRGKDISLEKRPGISRIFMVGDSFTFGVGAEENETIPYLFEKELTNKRENVEVINAGVGHSSPIIYYLKLKDLYLNFKPDLVILLFDFSDLRDDWDKENHAVYDENGEILYLDSTLICGKRDWWGIVRRNSEACNYVHNKIVRTLQKIQVLGLKTYIKAKLDGKRAKAVIATSQEVTGKIDPIEYDGYLLMRGRERMEWIMKHWKLTEDYLVKIRDLLDKEGIGFALVIYPYGIHVASAEWGEGRVYWGFEEDKVYTDRYAFEIIEDFARKNNIYCVNTLDVFLEHKKENPREKLFFDLDGHMTPAGNRILSKRLAEDSVLKEMIAEKTIDKIYANKIKGGLIRE